jgi:hypothetical protein
LITTGVDAPGYFGSAFTAHHAAPKKTHILEKLDADFGVAEAKGQEELIRDIVSTQLLHSYDAPGMNGIKVSRRW